MNLKKLWALCLCCSFFSVSSMAQEKYSKVKIPLTTAEIKKFVFDELELDHFTRENNAVVVVLDSEELTRLKNSHFPYQLLVDDLVQQTLEENRNITPEMSKAPLQGTGAQKIANIIQTPAAFGTGGSLRLGAAVGNPGYFTYAEMTTIMQNLATNNPGLVSFFSIGNTAVASDGAAAMPIYGIKISDNVTVDENEPEVLFTALQHAREAIGGTSMIFFMQYLVANYNNPDNVIKALVDNREIYIIPCVNPQGYSFNYGGSSGSYPVTGGGLWRKNRRNTGGGASNIGVDINRNYLIDWGNCAGATSSCGSNVKTSDTYYGPSVFSEPETQAIRTFVQGRNFVTAIDQHCYGPYYSLPYGRPTLHPVMNHVDSSFYTFIPALMGMYNGHRAGNSPETVNYEVAGGIKDWLLLGDIGVGTKGKIYGMTGEAGGGNFWAPVSQIIQLCKENCFQNLQLAYSAGAYYDIQDMADIAVNSMGGTLSCQIRKIGFGNGPVTISLIPIQNITTSTLPITTTVATYFDTHTAVFNYTLPASIQGGYRIKYAWKVEAGGIAVYDTVTKYYTPITLLNDNMEAPNTFSTNWIGAISPAGPTGWGFTNTSAFGGSQSMTESPTGLYTTSSTRTATYRNTLDLNDAIEAYLSFWVRHRAENFRDRLQVQVQLDGAGAWIPVSGTTTVTEDNTTNGGSLGGEPALTGIRNEWTRELFDLTPYVDHTVSLRFRFISDNDASSFAFERDEGFFIDNVKVIKTAVLTPLAVNFDNFYGKLLPNKSVQLDWIAHVDAAHDHFDVERSTDENSNFSFMTSVNGSMPYKAFDYAPVFGNNYYRIKQVNHDGTFTYSKTIKIVNTGKMTMIVYPNPVKDILTVKVNSSGMNDELTLQVTDAAGRKVYEQNSMVNAGTTDIKINLQNLPPQLYFLKVMNSRNELLNIEKFIKQ